MKKILSMALALTMMLAVCVPAFAVTSGDNLIEKSESSESLEVKTSADASQTSYTVTIPTTPTTVAWNSAADIDISYSVTCRLKTEEKLYVTVSSKNEKADTVNFYLKDVSNNKLAYTPIGFTEANFNPVSDSVKNTVILKNVQWGSTSIGEYSDTFTYSVDLR